MMCGSFVYDSTTYLYILYDIYIHVYIYKYLFFSLPNHTTLRPHENPKRGKLRSECRSCHLGEGSPYFRTKNLPRRLGSPLGEGKSGWWQLKYFFIFTPKIGEDSHSDSYFSKGWKPQPDVHGAMVSKCVPFPGWKILWLVHLPRYWLANDGFFSLFMDSQLPTVGSSFCHY